ncbi:hypothetical protein BDV12DRAFT_159919 [Aspergillus spectabilis]
MHARHFILAYVPDIHKKSDLPYSHMCFLYHIPLFLLLFFSSLLDSGFVITFFSLLSSIPLLDLNVC